MTVRVPIEAARVVAAAKSRPLPDVNETERAILELVEFVEHFESRALPGMTVEPVAGELREIILTDPTLEADTFSLIRLNGRVFAPEVIEVAADPFGLTDDEAWEQLVNFDDRTSPAEYPDMALINREELSHFMRSSAVCELGDVLSGEPMPSIDPEAIERVLGVAKDGELITSGSATISSGPLAEEGRASDGMNLADALVGLESVTRFADSHHLHPGAVTVQFAEPADSWPLFNLLSETAAGR